MRAPRVAALLAGAALAACTTTPPAPPPARGADAASAGSVLQRVVTPELERAAAADARVLAQPSPQQAVAEYERRHREAGRRSVPAGAGRTATARAPAATPAPVDAVPVTVAATPVTVAAPATGSATPPSAAAAPPRDALPDDSELLRSGSGFAGIMGAFTGLTRACLPAGAGRDEPVRTFRTAYRAQDLHEPAAAAGAAGTAPGPQAATGAAAAAAAGGGAAEARYAAWSDRYAASTPDCAYVRSQLSSWAGLVRDLTGLSAGSAEQFRRGLVTEIRRSMNRGGA